MSRNRYPRIGEKGGGVIPKNAACKICGATERVRAQAVQVNWFRGDDDVHPVCKDCLRAGGLLEKLGYRVEASQ